MYVRGIKGFGFGITCCELKICDKGATLKGHGLRVGLPRQGGINHCRLTNFRGLMNNAECSPVIGWGITLLNGPSPNLQVMGFYQPITGL